MEEVAGFQEWEFLGPSDGEPEPDSENSPRGSESASGGTIKADYFAVEAEIWSPHRQSTKKSTPDEGNPDWIESSSGGPIIHDESPNQGFDFQRENPRNFSASEDTLAEQESPIMCSPFEGAADDAVNLESAVLVQGQEKGGEGADAEEAREEEHRGSLKVEVTASPTMERAAGLPVAKGEKAGFVWYKLPMELLKFLAFRIRLTWSIPMAAVLMGAVMLGKKLYNKKPKSRRVPLKVAVGDKVSPFPVPVSRLSEAFSAVKRVPVIRASLPAAGAAPWPAVALR